MSRKSGGLSLVLVLLFLTVISSVSAYYGVACDETCTSTTIGACGIAKKTTTGWDNFGGGGNGNCIYQYQGSSCSFGACAPVCLNPTTFAVVTCGTTGAISLRPSIMFFNPTAYTGRSAAGRSASECSVDLKDNFNKLLIGVPQGGFYTFSVDGTAQSPIVQTSTGSALTNNLYYSVDTRNLAVSGKRIVSNLKVNTIDFTLANPCNMVSYFPGTESYTSTTLDCLYGPSAVAGCCAYSATDFRLNTNKIVKATSGSDAGRWFFCADTTLHTQSLSGYSSSTYWRESGPSRYKFDRIDFTRSAASVSPAFRGVNGTYYDVLATDYVGDQPYGWLICKTDGFFTGSGAKLNPTSNILKSISSALPQITVEQALGGGNDGALVNTPGSTTMSLKDFLKMLGGVTVASPTNTQNTQTPDVYYSSSSFNSDLTYYEDSAYSNEKTIDRMQGSIVVDPTDMKLRKDASNRMINNEPLIYGRKFPSDKPYYDIQIKDSVTGTVYNSREHILFRKDASGSRFAIDTLPDKAFVIQNDNTLTATVDESGYLKPVYISLDEFNTENNKGKTYDVILNFCSNKNSIQSGTYGSGCAKYEFKNLLRLGFVVDDKSTLASSAFFCKDTRIYECCGRNFYCMNKEMLGNNQAENLAKTFADGTTRFQNLRRSSQFVDVVYDPDFEVINVSQRDNEVKIYPETSLSFIMGNSAFLFKKDIDGTKFTNLEFDFFTYFDLDNTNITVCLKSGRNCCVNVGQRITPRVFEHLSVPLSSFSCYNSTAKRITIDSLQVYASKKSSRNYIRNCIINPSNNNECNNLFVVDRFFVSKSGDPSYFCGSNRTWIRDFDLDPIACDDTPGMYWAGGSQGSAGSDGLVANNKNCCGDDPGETWENPNGNGACVNGRYIFNNQRYMDSYRLTESDVTLSKNIDYAQILSYDGKLYGCNLDGITVGTKVFTVNAASGDTLDTAAVTTTKITSPATSVVAFKGTDFNLHTPYLNTVSGVKECSVKGSFYCSPRDGWRKDSAKDFTSESVFGNERIGYSDIATDISGSTKANLYLLDGSDDQMKSVSERSGEFDGCCPVGWCWNGLGCTQNQRSRANDWLRLVKDDGDNAITDADSFYRCIDGKWTSTPPTKKTWQSKDTLLVPSENIRELNYNPSGVSGTTNGFCPRSSDCLVNPSVPSNRYNKSFDYLGNNRCDVAKIQGDVRCVVTTSANAKTIGYVGKGNCSVSGLMLPGETYSAGTCTVTKTNSTKVTGVIGISSQAARGQDFLNDYLKTVMTNQGTRLYEDIELYKFPNIQDIQCIPQGYYIGDYFCGNDVATGKGQWTSRTSIMFEQLSNFSSEKGINDKYSIHCGNLEEVFNTKPEFSTPAEYNNKGCVLRGNCSGGYCPSGHGSKEGFSIMALELNSKNSNMLSSMKISKDLRRPFGQELYNNLVSNQEMFLHYADANIIFVSKDSAIPGVSMNQNIFTFFERVMRFFMRLVPNTNDFKPSAYLQQYYIVDKIYMAKSGSKVIFASSGYGSDSEIMTQVVYSGFSQSEITNIKNQFDRFVVYEKSRESNWIGAVDYLDAAEVSSSGKELKIEFTLQDSYLLSNVFYEDLSKSSKGEYPTNMFWDRLIDDFVVQTRMD